MLLPCCSLPLSATVVHRGRHLQLDLAWHQANGVYNPQKLMGVTTLDVCRAQTFIAENQGEK